MIDPDLKKELDDINVHLTQIKKNSGSSMWKSFATGTLSGLGSVFGVAIALAIIGWVLNTAGVIPAFRGEVTKLNQALDELRNSK